MSGTNFDALVLNVVTEIFLAKTKEVAERLQKLTPEEIQSVFGQAMAASNSPSASEGPKAGARRYTKVDPIMKANMLRLRRQDPGKWTLAALSAKFGPSVGAVQKHLKEAAEKKTTKKAG